MHYFGYKALFWVEQPINQRIKFLLDTLKLSAREFSRAVGVADNNTQNYIAPRFAQPKADYLEKVLHHFESINPVWLLTGKGEPFLTLPTESTLSTTNAKKISRNQIVGTNHGTAYQEHNTTHTDDEALKNKLTSVEKERDALRIENEWLRLQLKMQEALIAAKDETISVLRVPHHGNENP